MTDTDVEIKIKTEAVSQAFEMIRLKNLPEDVLKAYSAQDKEYAKYSKYTESEKEEGRKEVRAQMAAQIEQALAREKEAKVKEQEAKAQAQEEKAKAQEAKAKAQEAQERADQMVVGMIDKGIPDDIICQIAGVSQSTLAQIKRSIDQQ